MSLEYYDTVTGTWFESELHALSYHTTGAEWEAVDLVDRWFEEGAVSVDVCTIDPEEYDRMEEQAGDYSEACDLLLEAMAELLTGRTARKERNALRTRLQEGLPARVLDNGGWRLQTILALEQAPKRTRRTSEAIPFN